jgi:hypothetical protein
MKGLVKNWKKYSKKNQLNLKKKIIKTKTIKQGYAISSDVNGKFFTTKTAAEKYIKRENKMRPSDCQMKSADIYRTTNKKN